MTFGFALLTIGSLLLYSGYQNSTIAEVLQGLSTKQEGPGETGFASLLSGAANAVTPGSGGEGPAVNGSAPKGLTTFDGKQVCKWVAEELQWARQHGWTGGLESGYRSKQEQAEACKHTSGPCATPGKSNHQGTRFPKCAADVTQAAQLEKILSKKPGRKLHYTGKSIGDTVHFSSGLTGV